LGGNTNINAGVCPLPESDDIEKSFGPQFVSEYEHFLKSGEVDILSRPTTGASGLDKLAEDLNTLGIRGGKIRGKS
jgi:hypothetical protein